MTIIERNKQQAAIEQALKLAFIKLQQTGGFTTVDGVQTPDRTAYNQILTAIRTFDPNFAFGEEPMTRYQREGGLNLKGEAPVTPRFFDRMDDATREATPQDYILFVKDRYLLTVRPEAYIEAAVIMRKPDARHDHEGPAKRLQIVTERGLEITVNRGNLKAHALLFDAWEDWARKQAACTADALDWQVITSAADLYLIESGVLDEHTKDVRAVR